MHLKVHYIRVAAADIPSTIPATCVSSAFMRRATAAPVCFYAYCMTASGLYSHIQTCFCVVCFSN